MSLAPSNEAEPHLGPLAAPTAGLRPILEQTVARVFDVDTDLIRRPTRGRARVALARQVTMYLAHVACGLSLTEPGALLERDRTTVAHACQVVEERRDDPRFDRAIELLEHVTKVLTRPCSA
jgi:chromosomal replication initiation ATPase DnaA